MTRADRSDWRKLRILFVTQWFEPEPAFKGARFAAALQTAGHDVRVVTGFPNYPGGKIYPGYRIRWRSRESVEGIAVDRLALWPSHDRSSIGRVANYLSFFISVLIYCLQHMRRFDVAYVYHPPITPGLAAAIAGKVSGTPFILDVQDLWPDSVAVSGMANGWVVRLLDGLCRFVYGRAAMVIGQSQGIAGLLAERGVQTGRLDHIYNWSNYSPQSAAGSGSDIESNAECAIPADVSLAFAGQFNIVYGGNLGQAQALECLVAAAISARRSDPRIRLHLIGDGIARKDLAVLAAASPDAVVLHGPLPRSTVDRIFEQADVLALHLKDDALFRHTIPSKLQHYMSVGRPILAGIAGEGAHLLSNSGAARVFAPMDNAAAARAMLDLAALSPAEKHLMQRSSKDFYNATLSFDSAISKTLAIIERAAR